MSGSEKLSRWARLHPSLRNSLTCLEVSTPSATAVLPGACAKINRESVKVTEGRITGAEVADGQLYTQGLSGPRGWRWCTACPSWPRSPRRVGRGCAPPDPVSLSSLAIPLGSPCCLNCLARRSTDTIRGRSLQCRVRCGNSNHVVYLDGKDKANRNETGDSCEEIRKGKSSR